MYVINWFSPATFKIFGFQHSVYDNLGVDLLVSTSRSYLKFVEYFGCGDLCFLNQILEISVVIPFFFFCFFPLSGTPIMRISMCLIGFYILRGCIYFFITVLSLFIRLHYFYQSIFRFADSFAGSNLLFILSGKFFIWFIVLFNFRNFIFLINYILLSFSLRRNLPLYFPLII